MRRRNDRTNRLIMWTVTACDFVLLNAVLLGFVYLSPRMANWEWEDLCILFLVSNMALMVSEKYYHTIIHEQRVSAGNILRHIFLLTVVQTLIAFVLMKAVNNRLAVGHVLVLSGMAFFTLLALTRLIERNIVKQMRRNGRNSRSITLVGSDPEMWRICRELENDPTTGYHFAGYYAPERAEVTGLKSDIKWLGTVEDLLAGGNGTQEPEIGDEMYVCLSRKDHRETIRRLARLCDSVVTRFYYVPVSVESLRLNLKREYISDIEVYTTNESPLQDPVNSFVKRVFDIAVSSGALVILGLLFPLVYIIIKIQSPGPIFFKQLRTGLGGRDFLCYKFRSMHVNEDADRMQATKDDPRKFPFGNFMRKANIDELPQFWNVLKGDMSVVGPRPHMLAHTEQYSQLINKYMVRHFVKPGVTGWAQVTGFRGETKELWQMEGRVKRDIWYIENWSIWLDLRIIWLTVKSIFIHDEQAY